MLLKSLIYSLVILIPFLSLSMENNLHNNDKQFDIEEMLKHTVQLPKNSLRNILINYYSYGTQFSIEDIDQLNIPQILRDEIRMRKMMFYLKISPEVEYNFPNLDISQELKNELIERKKQIFDKFLQTIESDEQLKALSKNVIEGLKKTKNINFRQDPDYESIIHSICKKGDISALLFVIALGANLNLRRVYNFAPIHSFASPEIARCLLLESCNIDPLDRSEKTPLMRLCSFKTFPTKARLRNIKFLIKNRCNINFTNIEGNTALMYATKQGHKELVELLIKCGALPNITNKKGQTALDIAKEHHFDDIYEILKTSIHSSE